jgi:hypothetical protein
VYHGAWYHTAIDSNDTANCFRKKGSARMSLTAEGIVLFVCNKESTTKVLHEEALRLSVCEFSILVFCGVIDKVREI